MKEMLKRELNRTYLILSSEDAGYEESYEIQMLTNNKTERILPLHVHRLDGHLQLFFEVSSKQTLKACAERNKLSAETIRKLFAALDQLIREVKEYLLDMESVPLDLEHIYTREGDFYFCYCPWEKKEILSSFRSMLEEVLGNLDYHDTEGVELAYHLYQNACKGDFCIAEILEEHGKKEQNPEEDLYENYFLEMDDGNVSDALKEEKNPEERKTGFLEKIIRFFLKKDKQKPEELQVKAYSARQEQQFYFRENQQTEYMKDGKEYVGNTMLLGNMPAGDWRLRPLLPGYEEFCVTGDSFLVGKKKDSVDGYIGRDTISRIHCRLFVKENGFFIADANSTNGTFVNGESIPPGKDVEIYPGDRIMFADVEYECYNSL